MIWPFRRYVPRCPYTDSDIHRYLVALDQTHQCHAGDLADCRHDIYECPCGARLVRGYVKGDPLNLGRFG